MSLRTEGGRAGFMPFAPCAGVRRRAPFRSIEVFLRADIIDTPSAGERRIALGIPVKNPKKLENFLKLENFFAEVRHEASCLA